MEYIKIFLDGAVFVLAILLYMDIKKLKHAIKFEITHAKTWIDLTNESEQINLQSMILRLERALKRA